MTAAAAGTPARSPLAGADGSTAYLDLTALTREQEDALAAWLADPDAPKVLHDAKEPLQALSTRGLPLAGVTSDTALAAYLVRPDQRSFDLEDLVVRHLGRELQGRGGRRRPGRCSTSPPTTTRRPATRWSGPAPCSSSSAVLDDRLEETGGTELLRDLELPLVDDPGAHGAHRHRRRRAGAGRRSRPTSRPRCARPRRTRTTPSGGATSTSARPSSCRRCSSTSSACRRPSAPRPATPPTPTRSPTCSPRPSTRSSRPCCGTATRLGCGSTVEGLIKSVAPRPAHPHDLHPDHRGHRPPVVDRPEPAERADPHRGGSPHPRGLRRRRRLRVADVGRLQPDRDADHGAPVRRRGPDRGVPHRRGPAPLRRARGCSTSSPTTSPPRCAARSRR